MTKENQPTNQSESILTPLWHKISSLRWQSKALILGSIALIIAAA